MATYLQSFKSGFIAREGDKYEYHQGRKRVGVYDSIDQLVKAQEETSGKQDQESERSAQAPVAESTDVATAPKAKAKRTRKKKTQE